MPSRRSPLARVLKATAIRAVAAAYKSLVGLGASPADEWNEQLREVIEASPAGMLVVDGEGRIVLINAEIERLFGYSRTDLVGDRVDVLVPAAVRAQHMRRRLEFARQPKQRLMGGGRALHGVRKDGSEFALEIGLSPLHTKGGAFVIVSVVDISERERTAAERERVLAQERKQNLELEQRVEERTAALRTTLSDQQARERWFSTTMRSIADAVVSVDRKGAIAFMNPAAGRLLGASFAEVTGRPARALIHIVDPERGEPVECPLERVLREQKAVQLAEATLKLPGSQLQIADSAAPVVDNGELLGAVMVFRDVTAARAAEKQLAVAERMASLGTLAAGVAHEINNPLFVVMANADFIMERLEALSTHIDRALGDEMARAQRDLLSAAARIRQIVSDLKTFSRPEGGTGASCDLHDAVAWAVRATAHEFRGRAAVLVDSGPVSPVAADETRIGQILVNLLLNAAQAIPPGHAETNRVTVTTRTDQLGNALIDISDTGPGMPPSLVARIFEPFFTTKPVGVGTGLGLAICRGLVGSVGGELWVHSRLGVGSTFHVRLPTAREAQRATLPSLQARARSRARVLLVDDDELVLHAIARALSAHTVVTQSDPRSALALLSVDHEFDVILCDMLMPGLTGVQFYDALLRQNPTLARRLVFMTGGIAEGSAAELLASVPNERLQKPFGAGELEAAVQRILSDQQ
jgi:PAS domain S-box-containing protein